MELSNFTRYWLINANGPKATELRKYVLYLEDQLKNKHNKNKTAEAQSDNVKEEDNK